MDQYADGQPLTSNTGAWLDFAQKPWEAGGLGLAKHQAAGLVGNLVNESGADLNPWGPTGDNSTAWGTAQWRGDRLDKLKTMFPDNYHTVEAQQAFMRHEFETSENKALRALQSASTPEEAADAVNHLYERSADTTGRRAAAASAIYNGQDPAAAMNAAIKSGGGRGALAYAAGDDGEDDTGALSATSALGRGALQTIMPDAKEDDGIHKWGKKLTMAGAALASISSPQQAYALNSQAAQMGKEDDPKFTTRIGKDGSIYRMSSGGGVQVYRPGADPAAATGDLPHIGDWNKSGDEYLASIPEAQREIVQAIATGSFPLSQYKLNDPKVLALAAAARHYDPSFEPAQYGARAAGWKDWATGGKSADIVKSLNQSIGHLSELPDKYDALHNGQSPLWNAVGNGFNNQVLGKTGVTGFIPAAHAVADEMGKLFKGANLSDREIKQWSEALNENMSPDQMKDSIKTLRGLMQHSMAALEQKRKAAVGETAASKMGPLLSGEASSALDKLDQWAQPNKAAPVAMPKGVNSIKVIQP